MKRLLTVILFAMAATAPAQMMPSNTTLGIHANDVRTSAVAAWQYRQVNLQNLQTSSGARLQYRAHQNAIAKARAQIVEDFSTITKLMDVMHNDLENAEMLQGVE